MWAARWQGMRDYAFLMIWLDHFSLLPTPERGIAKGEVVCMKKNASGNV
jgi:hypothetical protein